MREIPYFILLCTLFVPKFHAEYLRDFSHYERDNVSYAEHPCQGEEIVEKNLNFVRGGLSEMFWSEASELGKSLEISSECASDVRILSTAIRLGDRNSFSFLDSSSAAPSALLEGTSANHGDYDQCLRTFAKLGHRELSGSYCSFELYPQDADGSNSDISLHDVNMIRNLYFTLSLCLPLSCGSRDAFKLIRQLLKCHSFYIVEDVVCDTATSVTVTEKLRQAHVSQKFAASFLVLYFILFFWANVRTADTEHPFSILDNHRELFYIKKGEPMRSGYVDFHKCLFVYCGQLGHIVACLECCRFISRLSNMKRVGKVLKWPLVQYVIDEGNFTLVAFFSGLASYPVISKALQSGQSLKRIVILKWLKLVPMLMVLMAFELIWPLVFNGPGVTDLGRLLVEHIVKYWWITFTMLSNFVAFFTNDTLASIPISYLHYSYTEFFLFIVGIGVILLLEKNRFQGMMLSFLIILLGNFVLYQQCAVNGVVPNLAAPTSSARQLVAYLQSVHMASHTYAPNYIIGLVSAYSTDKLNFGFKRKSVLYATLVVTYIGRFIAYLGPVAYHSYGMVSLAWTPFYIVICKFVVSVRIATEYFQEDFHKKLSRSMERNSDQVEPKDRFSLLRGLARLAFASYIINYWVIRADFFTYRSVFYSNLAHTGNRIFTCQIAILVSSYIFHLVFVAPLDRLRKTFFGTSFD